MGSRVNLGAGSSCSGSRSSMERMDTSDSNSSGGTRITAETSEQLLKTLECPVCMEVVIPPVFNCGNGHIICGLCHPRVPKCGLCASNFTTARNYTVESILALIDTTCRNSLCSKALRADKLRDHLDTCEYRPIPCHEYSTVKCNGQLINFENYAQHLMDIHKNRCKTAEGPEVHRINLSNSLEVKWPLFLLSHNGNTFLLHRKSVAPYLLCWVSMVASEAEAINHQFTLRIQDPANPIDSKKSAMEWKVRAHSVHTQLNAVQKHCDCAYIPYCALTHFCERSVRHSTGQVFEFKWTMTIRIDSFEGKCPESETTVDVVDDNMQAPPDSSFL